MKVLERKEQKNLKKCLSVFQKNTFILTWMTFVVLYFHLCDMYKQKNKINGNWHKSTMSVLQYFLENFGN
jgi:hypothetical protein